MVAPRRAATPKSADDERPPAPWGSFPLVELVVLAGILMLIAGLIVGVSETRGQTLMGTGLALASLAGLELSIREHFAGFRSHTTLLAGVGGVATMLATSYLGGVVVGVAVVSGLVAAALLAFVLVRAFRARSGGRSVKFR